jgi:hypothetical protein
VWLANVTVLASVLVTVLAAVLVNTSTNVCASPTCAQVEASLRWWLDVPVSTDLHADLIDVSTDLLADLPRRPATETVIPDWMRGAGGIGSGREYREDRDKVFEVRKIVTANIAGLLHGWIVSHGPGVGKDCKRCKMQASHLSVLHAIRQKWAAGRIHTGTSVSVNVCVCRRWKASW